MSSLRTIAIVRKNNIEEIRVSVTTGQRYPLIDVRVFSTGGRDEPQATRAGICIPRDQLGALIAALHAAEREASQ